MNNIAASKLKIKIKNLPKFQNDTRKWEWPKKEGIFELTLPQLVQESDVLWMAVLVQQVEL